MPVPSSFSPIEDAASSSFHELMQEQTREGQDELLSSPMVVGQTLPCTPPPPHFGECSRSVASFCVEFQCKSLKN